MIEAGSPSPPGAHFDGDGVNFALFSSSASSVELCLFDDDAHEVRRICLPQRTGDIWHGYIPRCAADQRYGYRVHGAYHPDEGLRSNANKLLLDPYARKLEGEFRWSPAVFDFTEKNGAYLRNDLDSAAFVPKCVVTDQPQRANPARPAIPWADTIIYEANVRGYTMRHPDVSRSDRGRFRGMTNASILAHLKSLGITTIELMPVQTFVDEQFLVKRGLRNFWGYNTLSFFVPDARYAAGNAHAEFVEMVNTIHDAGMEVLLDIAYNHTAESNTLGPTVSFRGIDNLSYYRTSPRNRGEYVNHTGCGNTINTDHPQVRALITNNMRYWVEEMGVDGFRFDLATILGRSANGFTRDHPLWHTIENDPVLGNVKLVAEPWDPGPDGYQLGEFPAYFAEWNDKYRDSVRRYWRADPGEAAKFAGRLLGSADVFESSKRGPHRSINLLTAHDGFTLSDLVSFEKRHNRNNGEQNQDGHQHNFSCNYGVEGVTADESINATRRKQRLNMLATLLFSQGTPMLLAGDELGNSQQGNNNAYAQDNETGWLDWSGLETDPGFVTSVARMIELRRNVALVRQDGYLHGQSINDEGWRDITWLRPDGQPVLPDDWPNILALAVLLAATSASQQERYFAAALLFNPTSEPVEFQLPTPRDGATWHTEFATGPGKAIEVNQTSLTLSNRSIALLTLTGNDGDSEA